MNKQNRNKIKNTRIEKRRNVANAHNSFTKTQFNPKRNKYT